MIANLNKPRTKIQAPLEHKLYDLAYNKNYKKVPKRNLMFSAIYVTHNTEFYTWMNCILKPIDLILYPCRITMHEEDD